ncbi:MAG: ABC-type tungstate transport system, permease protein [Candidatus Ozemobacter sibiricus]|uniref:ABC-type tungstate transport system, permease protein n=1 Tax=Candidatus Ozemobacter sibiricus TaxID=2268124 RepID=A0A367ZRQ5_9BACT|nr:MAG: ABC-type tungstate transport system, permease protein [Candidatus Ozemobacter sibiricus]
MAFILEMLAGAVGRLAALDAEVFRIFWFTVQIGLAGTLLGVVVALPLAWWTYGLAPRWKALVLIVLQMLLSVPTVIVGTLVYLLISRRGPLGALEMLFTPSGILIGEVMLIVPLVTVFLHSSLAQIPNGLVETARNLGYRGARLLALLLRECRAGVGAAVAVGFGRVVSEVGVAMILGGNIKGYTRTLTTAIALETARGDTELALALGLLLLAVALGNALLVHAIQGAAARAGGSEEGTVSPSVVPAADWAGLPAENESMPELAPIKLEGVTLTLADRPLFRNLSATLPLTGGLAVSGASGAGKTTLLRMIAGLVVPAAGRIDLGGRRAVLVFQRPFLFHGTVLDNLLASTMEGAPRRWGNWQASTSESSSGSGRVGVSSGGAGAHSRSGAKEARERAATALASDLGIAQLLHRDVSGLSGGEAARVSLGRALLADPDILLLDEALGHLDELALGLVLQVLRQFMWGGGGLVLVTHHGGLGQRLCRHRLRLQAGALHPEP